MIKQYVICITNGGYWDANAGRFRGQIFATLYSEAPDDETIEEAVLAADRSFVEVKEIYLLN